MQNEEIFDFVYWNVVRDRECRNYPKKAINLLHPLFQPHGKSHHPPPAPPLQPTHNPFHLISYFTSLSRSFSFPIPELFSTTPPPLAPVFPFVNASKGKVVDFRAVAFISGTYRVEFENFEFYVGPVGSSASGFPNLGWGWLKLYFHGGNIGTCSMGHARWNMGHEVLLDNKFYSARHFTRQQILFD